MSDRFYPLSPSLWVLPLLVLVLVLTLTFFRHTPEAQNQVEVVNASGTLLSYQLYVDGVLVVDSTLWPGEHSLYLFRSDSHHSVSLVYDGQVQTQITGSGGFGEGSHRHVIFVIPGVGP